jgi:mono/diheme cytochrome c family protein
MRRTSLVCGLMVLWMLVGVGPLQGWWWSKNMEQQPSKGPLDAFYPIPSGVLAVGSRLQVKDRNDADKRLQNPLPADSASVGAGRELFLTYCMPCHGESGGGDGPVAKKFVPPPPLFPLVDRRSDGYLYGTARFGGPVMPPYGGVLRDRDIWEIVDYLRSRGER